MSTPRAIPVTIQRTRRVSTFVDDPLFERITEDARRSGRIVPRIVEELIIEAYAERDRQAARSKQNVQTRGVAA